MYTLGLGLQGQKLLYLCRLFVPFVYHGEDFSSFSCFYSQLIYMFVSDNFVSNKNLNDWENIDSVLVPRM